MSNMTKTEELTWIRREWRREDKRNYALALSAYLRGETAEPQHPATLSLMGAQAIRLRLTQRIPR